MSESGTVLILLAGAAFRIALMQSGLFNLVERPELATPLNSFKRLKEGVVLAQNNQDPYAGVLFHETPLMLRLFTLLFEYSNDTIVNLVFVLVDIITALIMSQVADLVGARLLKKQNEDLKEYHEDAKKEGLLIMPEDVVPMSRNVQTLYLLHPYLIASCAAKTTTVFANFFLALFIRFALSKQVGLATFFLALATYQNFYPVMLIVPLVLLLSNENLAKNACRSLSFFLTFLAGLYLVSYIIMGSSWTFLCSTTGFILSVPELTPNMGLFWYFFTEMFEHFRTFFVCTFQINCFVYVYPLSARLKDQVSLLLL